MELYLDDDSAEGLLVKLLRGAGHDVQIPAEIGLAGYSDPVHFTHAIGAGRVLLSRNYHDFEELHDLVLQARGHHPGILMTCRENDPTRDLSPRAVVRTI